MKYFLNYIQPFIQACIRCGKRNEALYYINLLKDPKLAEEYKMSLGLSKTESLKQFFTDIFGVEMRSTNENEVRVPTNIFGKSDVHIDDKNPFESEPTMSTETIDKISTNITQNDPFSGYTDPFEGSPLNTKKSSSTNPFGNSPSPSRVGSDINPFGSSPKRSDNPFSDSPVVKGDNPFDTSPERNINPFDRNSPERRGSIERRASVGNPFGGIFGDWM